MQGNVLKNVLLGKRIILPSGKISKDKVNLAAGAITQPFAEMVWVTKGGVCELIHKMKAKVVVISTHRLGGINWDILLEFFKCNNIYDVDITPYGEEYHSRTEEINVIITITLNC